MEDEKIDTIEQAQLNNKPSKTSLSLPFANLTFPTNNIVVVNIHTGVTVDADMAKETHVTIYQHLGRDYGMIADRSSDYSMLPVPVFTFLNEWVPLKAMAIVAHRAMSKTITDIDKSLAKKPLEVFSTIPEAQTWLESLLSK